jgi:hypothetical protein
MIASPIHRWEAGGRGKGREGLTHHLSVFFGHSLRGFSSTGIWDTDCLLQMRRRAG